MGLNRRPRLHAHTPGQHEGASRKSSPNGKVVSGAVAHGRSLRIGPRIDELRRWGQAAPTAEHRLKGP